MKKTVIRQKTVVEQLMQEIRQMIASGTYSSNSKFPTEQELAEQFNVGRSSVREAVKALSHLGILESHTSQGTYISDNHRIAEVATAWSVILGYEKMKEVFTLGTALDGQVAVILMDKLKELSPEREALVAEVGAVIGGMRKAAQGDNLELFQKNFAAYFVALYEASGNMVFVALNECIDSLIVKKVCDSYARTGNMENAVDYLEKIWNLVLSRSFEGCIRAVQDYGVLAYQAFEQCYQDDQEVALPPKEEKA